MKKYTIEKVSKATCQAFLATHHHLSRQGCGFRSGFNYGLFEGDKLIGVTVFHTVSAWETVKGCFGLPNKEQKGFYELGRFALDPEHMNMSLYSKFIEKCIEQLRSETNVRALIAYADNAYEPGAGKVYKSVGFKSYGLTAKRTDFWVEQADGSFKKLSRGKVAGLTGEWRPRNRKERYLQVFDKALKTLWVEA